jgi:hypothetical protein
MKKALIVLLILGLAGGLFAQSFSGHVQTGARVDFGDDVTIKADGDGSAARARLSFASSDDNWGVSAGAKIDVLSDSTTTSIEQDGFSGWVKFGDGMFRLQAGRSVGGGGWQATSWKDWNIGGSAAGARLNVTAIPGLDFGVVFGFPKQGVMAAEIGNFLQETGVGAKYDAGIFVAGTQFKLLSPETTGSDMDVNWWFDAKVPLPFLTVEFESRFLNLLEKQTPNKFVGLKLSGDVGDLGWSVSGTTTLADDFDLAADVGLWYGIPISNDKASLEVGADASLTATPTFKMTDWDVYASLGYNLNSKVSMSTVFEVDGDFDFSKIEPWLRWRIRYNF